MFPIEHHNFFYSWGTFKKSSNGNTRLEGRWGIPGPGTERRGAGSSAPTGSVLATRGSDPSAHRGLPTPRVQRRFAASSVQRRRVAVARGQGAPSAAQTREKQAGFRFGSPVPAPTRSPAETCPS